MEAESIQPYRCTIQVKWSDLDANRHLRSSAYSDFAKHVWSLFFQDHGFGQQQLRSLDIGPISLREEIVFYHEVVETEPLQVDFWLTYLSRTAVKWKSRYDFFREDGTKMASYTINGGWLDLKARELIQPPEQVVNIMKAMPLIKEG